jgi:hypothetical protein
VQGLVLKIADSGRFSWGLNIDDMWKYIGFPAPKSVVIPYILSARLPGGRFIPQGGSRETRGQPAPRSKRTDEPTRVTRWLASFLKESGVDFVRCWFQWNFFEESINGTGRTHGPPGVSHFRFPLDDFVSNMAEAGIGMIGVLGGGYQRFLPRGLRADRLDDYLRALTRSSTEIVRHYKSRVKVWQIENEPNWWRAHYTGHWRKGIIWLSGSNQAPILQALHDVVRSECPGGTVVVNIEADDKRVDWKLYARYCDVLGLDFYPNYARAGLTEALEIGQTARQARRETGLPTFVIETGYPTGPRWLGYGEKRQVNYIGEACEEAYACDAIRGLGWFRFSDSYWRSFPPQENHFGLLTREGKPKAGWQEYVARVKQGR